MEKKQKYFLLVLIGATCFTGLILFNFYVVPEWQSSLYQSSDDNDDAYTGLDDPLTEVHNITLIVDFDGEKTTIKVEDFNLTNGETTAFHAVDKWCVVEYWEGKTYITYIDRVGEGWTYYVNEPPLPSKPAIEFYLDNGDTVYWIYVGS